MTKDLKIIILGRVLQIIIMLVSIRLLTTFLSEKEMGNYYIILALLSFFNLIFLNPSEMFFSRYLIQWSKSKDLLNAFLVYLGVVVVATFLSGILFYFISIYMDYGKNFNINIGVAYILMVVFFGSISTRLLYSLNMLGYRLEFIYFMVGGILLSLMFSIINLNLFGNYALSWVFGVVMSQTILIYFMYKKYHNGNRISLKRVYEKINLVYLKYILVFILPIMLTTLLLWFQNYFYRFIVENRYGIENLAYLALGVSLAGSIFTSLEAIAKQYYVPIFFKKIDGASKEGRTEAWNNIAKQMFPIYLISLIFVMVFAKQITMLLVDEKFYGVYTYVLFGAVIEFFRVMIGMLNDVGQSEHKTYVTILPYFVGALLSGIVLYVFNFQDNLWLVLLTLAISNMIIFFIMFWSMKRLLPITIDLDVKVFFYNILPLLLGAYFLYTLTFTILFSMVVLVFGGVYLLYIIHKYIKGKTFE